MGGKTMNLMRAILLILIWIITAGFTANSFGESNKYLELSKNKFEQYVNLHTNGYVLCPPPSNPSVNEKLKKGFLWYQKQAIRGDVEAQYLVGAAYLGGIGVKSDYSKAKKWIYQSATQGYIPAQIGYGLLLKNDDPEKIKWFKKSVAQGNQNGTYGLAMYFLFKKEYKKGIDLMILLANRDFMPAQESLGIVYNNAFGVPQDYKKALYWYKKALNHNPMPINSNFLIMSIWLINSALGNKSELAYWDKQLEDFHKFSGCNKR
ncbi:MAG: sel1 repeat family protein [Proteobacteria bacterium]|nr:sel1 repeat family protein [Pseudomonadota bacterium]